MEKVKEKAVLFYDWDFWARDKQKPPPGDWRTWLIMAGRGFGKTRTEFMKKCIQDSLSYRAALLRLIR